MGMIELSKGAGMRAGMPHMNIAQPQAIDGAVLPSPLPHCLVEPLDGIVEIL